MTKHTRQTWWPVYTLALIMMGLLFLAHRVAPSPGWRTFLDVGIVVTGYGLIGVWLETHSGLLLDRPSTEADIPVTELPQLERPATLRYQFYVKADLPIIYERPAQPNGNARVNGHVHPAENPLSLPKIDRRLP